MLCDDEVFDAVYTERTLEHFFLDHVELLLKELYGVMKKGAVIRITVPDLEKYIACYTNQLDSENMEHV